MEEDEVMKRVSPILLLCSIAEVRVHKYSGQSYKALYDRNL